MLLLPATVVKAELKNWYYPGTNTEIKGQLYSSGTRNTANASTINNSRNNKKVIVKIYASAGGSTLSESWNIKVGYPKAWCSGTARRPDWWGSMHSTTPTKDPWKYLNLYVGNM